MTLKMKKEPAPHSEARWFDYDVDTKIQLVGLDNEEYQIALERMRRRLIRNDAQFPEGDIGIIEGEKTEHDNQCMLIATFLLKDWSGAEDEQGNPLKYSPQVGRDMLKGDVDFFLFVLAKASEVAADLKKEKDEAVGKPSPASSGKRSGRATSKKGAQSIPA
ncbi:hypothetical protein J3P77_09660 [Pseudomonas sp. R1-18]|uniref:hypothetical protein n=1 Tax=Pseudomonas sp. R1-18 TaxID=1632772 RepID=UPI003DAA2A54